ncbi:hypothetical protein FOZ62_023635 [Perkinsus olseni]|uniref:Uncharacterized protein n=1 Tax=Perkinsus olseni TaxID=32597 RepID=A0A7J6S0Q9_PEROL|nr:hypothetical protein FOZ62_023635 [Perkinsus olseni]
MNQGQAGPAPSTMSGNRRRCVVEERRFGADAKLRIENGKLSQEVLVTVGGANAVDISDDDFWKSERRPCECPKWAEVSRVKTLWWVPEPAGLPFTRSLPEPEGLGCEDTIISWGKALLKERRVSKASAVLAVARNALKEARQRDYGDESGYSFPFGAAGSLLSSRIAYFLDDKLHRLSVNLIKFVDSPRSRDTIELPLLSKNLDLMRFWISHEEDAHRMAPILETAARWGFNFVEEGISKREIETRFAAVAIAVAAGWNERLAPGE